MCTRLKGTIFFFSLNTIKYIFFHFTSKDILCPYHVANTNISQYFIFTRLYISRQYFFNEQQNMKMTAIQHFIYRKIYLKNIYQRNINVLLLIQISNSCPFTTRNWIVLLPITKQLLPSPLYFTYYKQCSPRITIRIILQGNIKIRTRKMSVQNRHTV